MKKFFLVVVRALLLGVLAVSLFTGSVSNVVYAQTTTVASKATTDVKYPEAFHKALLSLADKRFDFEKWKATAAAEKIAANARNDFLYPQEMDPAIFAYWDALGIKREVHDADNKDLKWTTYTPVRALAANNTAVYPVVFNFGREGTGIAELGAKEGFITVRPGNNAVPREGKLPADGLTPGRQVVRILDLLKAQGYPIDRSRVYVTGHSIGGMASAWAGLEFPEVVTAIAMHSSLAAFNTNKIDVKGTRAPMVMPPDLYTKAMDYDIPMWLAVGEVDFDQLPIRTEGAINGLNLWLQVNDCPTKLTLPDSLAAAAIGTDPAVKLIGVPGDKTWAQTIDGVVYRGVDYFRKDGVKMIEIIGVENQPHWVTAAYPELAWKFMSRFSKDANGKLIVAK